MTVALLADQRLDRLRPVASSGAFLTGAESDEDVPFPLRALCSIGSWDDAVLLAQAAADGIACHTDHQGFTFGDDGSVLVIDPLGGRVAVSRPAFRRLVRRLLDALIDAAVSRGDAVTGESWWPDLLAARDRLAAA